MYYLGILRFSSIVPGSSSSKIDKETAKAFIKVAKNQICVARNGTEFMQMMNKTVECTLIKLLVGR